MLLMILLRMSAFLSLNDSLFIVDWMAALELKWVSSILHMALIYSDWFCLRIFCAFLILIRDHTVVNRVNRSDIEASIRNVRYWFWVKF